MKILSYAMSLLKDMKLRGKVIAAMMVVVLVPLVASASQEQSDGIEQAAAASKTMGKQAHSLNELVRFFTAVVSDECSKANTERRSAERAWTGCDKPVPTIQTSIKQSLKVDNSGMGDDV